MRTTVAAVLLVAAAALLPATYTYYYSDSFSSINSNNWSQNGSVSAGSSGLTAASANGGSLIFTTTPPSPSNIYLVDSVITLTTSGGTYIQYVNATPDAMSGPSPQGSYVSVELQNPTFSGADCSATMVINQRAGGSVQQMAYGTVACHNGMHLRTAVNGGTVSVFIDGLPWGGASTSLSGNPGMGAYSTPAGNSIANVSLGPGTTTPPSPVNPQTIEVSASSNLIHLRWTPPSDGNGPGIAQYYFFSMERIAKSRLWPVGAGAASH